ncbi:glycoside hydrolase family 25 protein [Sinorhizobium numidicum]|uniref:Glycoside hydrolase family 25 protein n=1 Tax=Sinorhizobium numidicum TaxID=680248 RepID=A0ABY8D1X3_9HYPH|nr:glycoside hydrolase family 25 protein [Sinorhizobium numidicum]WEX78220.1 glycoside hydrolase family 25 protein [Sinorhizobium numidicum]WEX84879.1 glycoside hydrolase family 25 protein [Sinorhizobium numidicum]
MEKRGLSISGMILRLAALVGLTFAAASARASDVEPWKQRQNAIIVDAYEMNSIDWEAMLKDKRISGFIAKASDGLPESFTCTGDHGGDTVAHCKTMWRKYAVSRELYQTRRMIARSHGLLWGAYHLARPGNPVDQANHFLDYADPRDDEMMVLDIEGIDPDKYMSLDDAAIFAGHIKARTGRYPILYTNHITAKHIAANRFKHRLLSRLPLWYARYKPDIRKVFPLGNWNSYALWQFSSAHNCGKKRCPYRVPGTLNDIDVNVAAMPVAALKAVWASGTLLPEKPPVLTVVASAKAGAAQMTGATAVASFAQPLLISRAGAESGSGTGVDMTVTGTISVKAAEARLPYQTERR